MDVALLGFVVCARMSGGTVGRGAAASRPPTTPEGSRMPLSDEEQKILREIEAQLSASDPALVEQVARSTVYRHAGRNIKWAGLGFIAGLVLLVTTFATSLIAGFVGFLVMLACLFVIERNARKLGKAGLQSMTGWRGEGGVGNFLGETGRNLRTRFRRDDN